ncbi:MAG: hypothetical protein VXZ15_16015, partial [Planctomycetota bacterium]|nr:hypothetical protein [Planctomycetota bacterium]
VRHGFGPCGQGRSSFLWQVVSSGVSLADELARLCHNVFGKLQKPRLNWEDPRQALTRAGFDQGRLWNVASRTDNDPSDRSESI